MRLGELTRLYQAALEEQRVVHARMRAMTASESHNAVTHIDSEVARALAVLETAWIGAAVA